jgi:hypothetical protein
MREFIFWIRKCDILKFDYSFYILYFFSMLRWFNNRLSINNLIKSIGRFHSSINFLNRRNQLHKVITSYKKCKKNTNDLSCCIFRTGSWSRTNICILSAMRTIPEGPCIGKKLCNIEKSISYSSIKTISRNLFCYVF